jgi:hypothetical protein
MNPNLQRDILALVADTGEVKHSLEAFKEDCALWDRDRERKDLANLLEFLKRLENDVFMMQADWVSFAYRIGSGDGASPVFDSFQRAFVNLNNLFNDLKNLRTELNNSFLHSDSLKEFEIDWSRFWKTVEKIQENLLYTAIIQKKIQNQ